jgi:hypothetical protein
MAFFITLVWLKTHSRSKTYKKSPKTHMSTRAAKSAINKENQYPLFTSENIKIILPPSS